MPGADYELFRDVARDQGNQPKKLVIFDLEGVLTPHEFLLEFAERAGKEKYEKVLEEFQKGITGEQKWIDGLKNRIEILKGTPLEFAEEVVNNVDMEPGAAELTQALKANGWYVAIVSGGFDILKQALDRCGIAYDRFLSHKLIFEQGALAGVELSFEDKGEAARKLKDELKPDFVVAVGDGWNDVPMLIEANVAVGFNPKPKLRNYIHISAYSIEELAILIAYIITLHA